MKISRLALLIGMVLYVVSFFLPAAKEAHAIPGYLCAYLALVLPWIREPLKSLRSDPLNLFSILLSGWINPVFLLTIILLLRKARLGAVLRIALLFMFAAPWIFFYKDLRPQTGYFLWTGAMLLALFSICSRRPMPEQQPDQPGHA
jgi:hypothetical protein